MENMGIVYGKEGTGTLACTAAVDNKPTTHFPEVNSDFARFLLSCLMKPFLQYFTYSMLLVLISCAVYQMMISFLKAVYLIILSSAYLVIVHYQCYNIFDNQDFLLQTHDG